MECPNCHKPIAVDARFCGSCGQRIETAAPAAAGLQPALATAAASNSYGAVPPGGAAAGFPGLWMRIKNLLLTPRTEWPVIASESTGIAALYTGYVVPLSAAAAVLSFIHVSVIGVSLPFAGLLRSPLSVGLSTAVLTFVMGLVSLFVVGLIINALAPTFGGTRDRPQAMKVAAYSFTPGWLGALLALSPVLPSLLQLVAACYGIYVLYLGLPVLMRSPRERAGAYTATVVICCILLGVVLAVVGGMLGLGARTGLTGLMPVETHEQEQARSAQAVGNVIGGLLGTDDKGKAGLGAAINNLAKAGDAQEKQLAQSGPTPASDAAGSAPAVSAAADPAQNPVAAVGGLLAALGGSMGGATRHDPVDYKRLSALLPATAAGLPRTNVKGEGKQALGVKTTDAIADYGANGGTVHEQIADVAGMSGLLNLANMAPNESSEGTAGYEKDVELAGHTAHEKFDASSGRGEISMIIAKRFTVEVSGDGVPMSALEQTYSTLDLGALEGMKDEGAQP